MMDGRRFDLARPRPLQYALYATAAAFAVGAAIGVAGGRPAAGAALAPAAALAALGRSVQGGHVELDERGLHVRLGPLFRADVPYDAVEGVEAMPASWLWGLGVRTNLRDTVAVLTANRGVVEVRLNRRVALPLIPGLWRFRARKLRLSLEAPRDFIAALGLAVGPERGAAVEGRAVD